MPSKKKARSQARKAKKEEAKQQAASSSGNYSGGAARGGSSCRHMKLPEDHAFEDVEELFREGILQSMNLTLRRLMQSNRSGKSL